MESVGGKVAPSRTIATRSGGTPLAMMRSRMSSPSTITRVDFRSAQRWRASQNRMNWPWLNDVAADGHIGIHVADVVDKWFSGERRDESTREAGDRRIGHREDYVWIDGERARHREREIRKIIRDAAVHPVSQISSRADALDRNAVVGSALQQFVRDSIHRDRKRGGPRPR